MEVGERMIVKIILTAIVLVGCNIVAAGASGDTDIQGGALLSVKSHLRRMKRICYMSSPAHIRASRHHIKPYLGEA